MGCVYGWSVSRSIVEQTRIVRRVGSVVQHITPATGAVLCNSRTEGRTHISDSVSLLVLLSNRGVALRRRRTVALPLCRLRLGAKISVDPVIVLGGL